MVFQTVHTRAYQAALRSGERQSHLTKTHVKDRSFRKRVDTDLRRARVHSMVQGGLRKTPGGDPDPEQN